MLYCVVQEIERRKENKKGACKEIEHTAGQ